jgi:hypothetical protein
MRITVFLQFSKKPGINPFVICGNSAQAGGNRVQALSLPRRGWMRSNFGFLHPVLAAALGICSAQLLFGVQTPATQAPAPSKPLASTPAHKTVHSRKRPSAARHIATTAQAAAAAPKPVSPPPPDWPANDKPVDASVTWDSHGLRIDADNSSLEQILRDVSTATGAKVEGLDTDQRVYGKFGPGQARDVLSQLLQGTGYNVVMIGDQGQGTPRQIVLSTPNSAGAHPAANANAAQAAASDDDSDTDDQPQTPPNVMPMHPGFAPGAPPRSPLQIQMQQQQLLRQQQQQQEQQGNPPQN